MCKHRLLPLSLLATLIGGLSLGPTPVQAEVTVGFHGGVAKISNTDVRLQEPDDTDLTFRDVSWEDESFVSPIYYSLQLTWWLKGSPRWGIMGDFTHAKMIARREETVAFEGTRAGVPVSGSEPLEGTFSELDFTHGHNLWTVNGVYRWLPRDDGKQGLRGRLRPYVGAGLGVATPHVEVQTATSSADEYQVAGPVVQGFVGLDYALARHWSIGLAYKLTRADFDTDLDGGGSLALEPLASQFLFGASYSF